MEFDRAVDIVNTLFQSQVGRSLSDLELDLLRGAWHNLRYEEISARSGYSLNYLQRDVGPKFWRLLSDGFGRKLNKTNAKAFLLQQIHEQDGDGVPDQLGVRFQTMPFVQGNPGSHGSQSLQDGQRHGDLHAYSTGRSPTEDAVTTPSNSLTAAESMLGHGIPSSSSTPHTFPGSYLRSSAFSSSCIDWGEAIDVSIFYGRDEELATLTQWIVGDAYAPRPYQRCRMISLLGMGGIGKSSLAAKIAHMLQEQFEFVIWRSLRNAPLLDHLLAELVPFLSAQQDRQATPLRLLHWLRAHRCLVILDNVETIMQSGSRAGYYQPDYTDYGDLFRLIGEINHQSCVILTSREKPAEVGMMESADAWVRSLNLKGSRDAAIALTEAKGLIGSPDEKIQLCEQYGCSPLALKIVAATIHSLFAGDISSFFAQDTLIFSGLRRLLDEQWERLSSLERSVMYWLAINREWTTIDDLLADIIPSVTRLNILDALESLSWRSLIEVRSGSYTQQPIVMEYVLSLFNQRIVTELMSGQIHLFGQYALLKITSNDYIRTSQRRLILAPIATQLRSHLPSPASMAQCLHNILGLVHTLFDPSWIYAAGNLLNLATYLQINLTGWDFSRLMIYHADLQDTTLHHVNLAHANIVHARFTEVFSVIFCVAFNADGTVLATGDIDRTVSLWRVTDGSKLLSCKGHSNWVWAIAFSPRLPLLASSSEDHTIRVWNTNTGQSLSILEGHTEAVVSVAFSPNGHILASGSHDGTVRVWNAVSGDVLHVLNGHHDWVWSVAFCPTHPQTLVSVGADGQIVVWDIETNTPQHIWQGHSKSIRSVAYSSKGNVLATGSDDHTVRLWDGVTGHLLQTFNRHTGGVRSVAFSPDGALVVSGSTDQTIRVWQVETGHLLKTLHGHHDWVHSIAVNPQGTTLASGGQDQAVKLWDVATGQLLQTLHGHSNQIRAIAFSPNGQLLASGSDNRSIKLWDVETGAMMKTLRGHTNQVRSVVFAPSPTWSESPFGLLAPATEDKPKDDCSFILASSSMDHTIKLWDVSKGRVLRTLEEENERIRTIAFSPDQALLASGGENQDVRLWDVASGHIVSVLKGHTNRIMSVAFSPDGTILASGSDDQTVRLWDVATGTLLDVLDGHDHWVWAIAFSPDGDVLASSSADCTVRLWDVRTGQVQRILRGHGDAVIALAYHPRGDRLASSSPDKTIRFWNTTSGDCMMVLNTDTQWVRVIAFSPNGKLLASGEENELVKIWSADSGECLKSLRGDRPYEGMDITGVVGLTEAQKATLQVLGASERQATSIN